MKKLSFSVSAITLLLTTGVLQARENIEIVGSSTVFPFAAVVAETYARKSGNPAPKIESTGSGGGIKLFCSGTGENTPDITNSSRRIKQGELSTCKANGVSPVEVKVGYDGIALANAKSGPDISVSLRDLFLALAKEVPVDADGDGEMDEGKLVANTYETWSQLNPELPDLKIEVLGPPPTSGTRDAFVELAMEVGCQSFPWIKALEKSDKDAFKSLCHTLREDGRFIEAGENDNLIVQKLEANPNALGIFGFSFLNQNEDKVKGAQIDGVEISFENIASGDYPVSRPLYFYVKKEHVGKIQGIDEYLAEFTKDSTWGEEGYLTDKGMIPMPDAERELFGNSAKELTVLESL